MVKHELKLKAGLFDEVMANRMRVLIWKKSRDFALSDVLVIREVIRSENKTVVYTGRQCVRVVTHYAEGGLFGVELGYVVMSIRPATEEEVRNV